MGHACTPDDFPRAPAPNGEHPITALLAIVAIVLAILLIAWARVELHGTQDLQALVEDDAPQPAAASAGTPEDEAASSRWATGFSH